MANFTIKSSLVYLEEDIFIKITSFRNKEQIKKIDIDLIIRESRTNLFSTSDLNSLKLIVPQLRKMNGEQIKEILEKIEELIG